MPHVTKLLLKVILERTKRKINTEIEETQFGYRAQNGTREAIFCLNNINQKYLQNNKKVYACFIDYAKAFDRVHHIEIIKCLEKVGIDGKDIRLITNLYWHQAVKCQPILISREDFAKAAYYPHIYSIYILSSYFEKQKA